MKLGAVAEDLDIEWFVSGSAVDEAITVLRLTPPKYWPSAALEATIHPLPDGQRRPQDEATRGFIRKAGRVLATNFGMMFDPDTAETYPMDDPRRQL